jgi:hypothetical protein
MTDSSPKISSCASLSLSSNSNSTNQDDENLNSIDNNNIVKL